MSSLPYPEAPGPNPGQPGHYAHHDWLTEAVKALDQVAGRAFPPGLVAPYAGPNAPAGYLLCEGQLVGRGQYGALFDAIGTAYGTGDGSTTFGIPDLRQRVPVGTYATGSLPLGAMGGEVNHTLTDNEVPYHNHGGHTAGADANHSHALAFSINTSSAGNHVHALKRRHTPANWPPGTSDEDVMAGGGGGMNDAQVDQRGAHTHVVNYTGGTDWMTNDHGHAFATDHRGAGWAHNNMQPYTVLNYIIKT